MGEYHPIEQYFVKKSKKLFDEITEYFEDRHNGLNV